MVDARGWKGKEGEEEGRERIGAGVRQREEGEKETGRRKEKVNEMKINKGMWREERGERRERSTNGKETDTSCKFSM